MENKEGLGRHPSWHREEKECAYLGTEILGEVRLRQNESKGGLQSQKCAAGNIEDLGRHGDSSRGVPRGTDKRRLEDMMKKSRGDLNRVQMSSGGRGPNGGTLDGRAL